MHIIGILALGLALFAFAGNGDALDRGRPKGAS